MRQEADSEMAETLGNKTTFMRQPVLEEDGAVWEGQPYSCEIVNLWAGLAVSKAV